MKAVVFNAPNDLYVTERPLPEIGDYDALVKVGACGICGTDIHILRGEHIVKFPVVPGHEFAGEVVAVGSKVDNVKAGDRVTIDPNIVDNTCFFCRRGEIHLCKNLTAVGVNLDGGFAEYCSVPAVQCYKVPASLSIEEAAMVEPLACCIHGIDQAKIEPGYNVVILGAGFIGLLMVQLAKIAGAKHIIVSEPDERKRHLAARFGSDVQVDPRTRNVAAEVGEVTGVGADVVIEAAGMPETAVLAIDLARRGGTVLQFGMVSPDRLVEISPYQIYYKELTIRGSFVNPFTHSRAVELLASKQVDVMPLITHRFGQEKAAMAIQTARTGDAIKVLIIPD
ncbi:MAG: zinc-dependent alcohol dehydrogenase family protein [Armatimonadota bacterium]|nr:zinc-dependent alcohol dehydrogenase family protein [Armatimonadota bacterium]